MYLYYCAVEYAVFRSVFNQPTAHVNYTICKKRANSEVIMQRVILFKKFSNISANYLEQKTNWYM